MKTILTQTVEDITHNLVTRFNTKLAECSVFQIPL